jgi:glutamate-1-semialdehyde 2,1-aminomutase
MNGLNELCDRLIDDYRQRTVASSIAYKRACCFLPGGDSRSTLFFEPYPLFFDRGEGTTVWDLDGNCYVDFTGNHTALIHGYQHAGTLAAVRAQMERGLCFSYPVSLQYEFAELLHSRQPALELVRFCNSGTEATLNAIRAARAFTRRNRLGKIEGGYNGSQDDVMVSTHPTLVEAGDLRRPASVPRTQGVARSVLQDTMVLPYNELELAATIIEEQKDDLAAVIVEPILGSAGMIAANPKFLAMLREVTQRCGVVLIFDEVISFRVSSGGAQELLGITPDLTCLGKMIGGGFPLGVFGGRADIMTLFDPSHGPPKVHHPGSLNANPISLAAAKASLSALSKSDIDRLNSRGAALRAALTDVARRLGITLEITGLGSLCGLHMTAPPVRSWRDTLREDPTAKLVMFHALLAEGILIDPRGAFCLSTATTDADCDRFIGAFERALTRLRQA